MKRTNEPGECVVCQQLANSRVYRWYRLNGSLEFRACTQRHATQFVNDELRRESGQPPFGQGGKR